MSVLHELAACQLWLCRATLVRMNATRHLSSGACRDCGRERRKPWRCQAPSFPESVIRRELAFQAQIPRQRRPRVLANQLRRGALNSPVESAELEPVLCRQVRKHGNSSKADRLFADRLIRNANGVSVSLLKSDSAGLRLGGFQTRTPASPGAQAPPR